MQIECETLEQAREIAQDRLGNHDVGYGFHYVIDWGDWQED
jgi:hypothetical protein